MIPKDPTLVSAVLTQGLQACDTIPGFYFFKWILRIQFTSLCLQSKHLNNWTISSVPEKAELRLSLNGYAIDTAPFYEGPSEFCGFTFNTSEVCVCPSLCTRVRCVFIYHCQHEWRVCLSFTMYTTEACGCPSPCTRVTCVFVLHCWRVYRCVSAFDLTLLWSPHLVMLMPMGHFNTNLHTKEASFYKLEFFHKFCLSWGSFLIFGLEFFF